MSAVRATFTFDAIDRDPQHSFKKANILVLKDRSLISHFHQIIEKNAISDLKLCETVFTVVVQKVIHARFAVVFRRWKEINVKKNDQLSLRTKLKAQGSLTSKKGGRSKKGRPVSNGKPAQISNENQGNGLHGGSKRKLSQPFSDNPSVNRKRRKEILANKRHRKQLRSATTVSQVVGV
ncbi:hypothetical protein ACHAWF_003789 [Thalassiosira exigua]